MMTTRTTHTATIFLVLAIALSCKDNAKDTTQSSLTTESNVPAVAGNLPIEPVPEPAPKKAASHPPTVTLLEAGNAPLRVLRLKMKAGTKGTMRLSTNMEMSLVRDGTPQPPTIMPVMIMVLETKVTSVDDDGGVHYDFKLTSTDVVAGKDVPKAAVAALKDGLKAMHGLSGSGITSNRGFSLANKVNIPPSADTKTKAMLTSMQQSLAQVAAPLPEEAVGVGAKWKATTRITHQGLTVRQEAVYAILAIKGDVVTLAVQVDQSAGEQAFTPPGAPPGMDLQLLSLETKGGGETMVNLNNIVPLKASSHMMSQMKMAGPGGRMDVATKLKIEITGK